MQQRCNRRLFSSNSRTKLKVTTHECVQISNWPLFVLLNPKNQSHIFDKKHSKLLFLLHSSKKTKETLFSYYNHKILYFTCLKSCTKNFMKFDRTNWKILAFKVGTKSFFEHFLQFQTTLTAICGIVLHYGFWI